MKTAPRITCAASIYLGLAVALGAYSAMADPLASTPNIVVILADDLGWMDINAFAFHATGTPPEKQFYETPNIDRLAADGVAFSRCYSAPLCTPSRATLLTGRNSATFGFNNAFAMAQEKTFANTGHTPPAGYLPLDSVPSRTTIYPLSPATSYTGLPNNQPGENGMAVRALPALLPGYRSAFLGKWHVGANNRPGHRPQDFGFEAIAYQDEGWSPYAPAARKGWHQPGPETKADYLTDALTEMGIDWMRHHVRDSPGKPFLMYLAHFAVHTPFEAKADDKSHFERKSTLGWNSHSNPTYAAMLRSLDDSVGAIRAALKEMGVADNTVLLFLSDNGGDHSRQKEGALSNAPLRGYKAQTYEGGIRVPMIAAWPTKWVPDRWVATPVSIAQIAPTLMELAGADTDKRSSLDGPSLVPLLTNQPKAYRARPIFIHEPYYRSRKWKEDEREIFPPSSVMIDGDYKLIAYHDGENRLYHIPNDRSEQHDLSQKEPKRVAAMRKQLAAWRFANIPIRYDTKLNPDYDFSLPDVIPAPGNQPFVPPIKESQPNP